MGWYHVNKIGKGICLGDVDGIHYNEDFIEKHTPTKGEALELKQHDIRDDELEGYEAWKGGTEIFPVLMVSKLS